TWRARGRRGRGTGPPRRDRGPRPGTRTRGRRRNPAGGRPWARRARARRRRRPGGARRGGGGCVGALGTSGERVSRARSVREAIGSTALGCTKARGGAARGWKRHRVEGGKRARPRLLDAGGPVRNSAITGFMNDTPDQADALQARARARVGQVLRE